MYFRFLPALILLALASGPGSAQTILYTQLTGNHWVDGHFLVTGDQRLTGDLQAEDSILQTGTGPNFFNGSTSSFNGRICVGTACQSTEPLVGYPLQLKSTQSDMVFVDTSSGGVFADHDWRIRINEEGQYGADKFAIEDMTAATTPLTIMGGAPDNALWVDATGRVGLGTILPQADLHIVDATTPTVRLQQTLSPAYAWEMAGGTVFAIKSRSFSSTPFSIDANAADNSLVIEGTGEVGIGTADPEERLHVRTTDSRDAFALFDAAGPGTDAAFRLRQATTNTTWEFRNQAGSGRLNVGIAGGNTPFKIDDAANNNLLRLGLNGQTDVVSVTGRLLVNNTQLNVPDYVFAEGYELRPLAEVQAFIDANSHLPDVPSEAEIKANGVDMTEMQMTLLKKVEELTLYTLALEEARTTAQRQNAELIAELAAQAGRLATIEALLNRKIPASN